MGGCGEDVWIWEVCGGGNVDCEGCSCELKEQCKDEDQHCGGGG
jgi:hypothetical protein